MYLDVVCLCTKANIFLTIINFVYTCFGFAILHVVVALHFCLLHYVYNNLTSNHGCIQSTYNEINATQQKHDDVQKAIRERRWATQFRPEQFEDVTLQESTTRDYSFNLTGITPPQPPKWKQVDRLYEDFKKFK